MKTILALILVVSSPLMAFDYVKDNRGNPINWDTTKPIPYKILNEDLRDATLYAIQTWNEALDNKLTFVEQDGGITLDLQDDVASTGIFGNLLGITYCKILGFNGNVKLVGATIYIKKGTVYDVVVLHEMGHALGLKHSIKDIKGFYIPDDKPIMTPSINVLMPKTLHIDDIMGIRELYGMDNSTVSLFLGKIDIKQRKYSKLVYLGLESSINAIFWNLGDDSEYYRSNNPAYKYKSKGTYTVTAEYRGRFATALVQVGRPIEPKPKKYVDKEF